MSPRQESRDLKKPSRDWPIRLLDILTAIDHIAMFARGMTFEQFELDLKSQMAVLAEFTIIGEAAKHVPPDVASRYPHIPWNQIRGMRDVVVHVYFGVKTKTVWDTVQRDLPPLAQQIKDLLAQENQ